MYAFHTDLLARLLVHSGLGVTDAGQLARASHGAIRGDNYIAVRLPEVEQSTARLYNHSTPFTERRVQVQERLAAHAYKICHWNPEGYIQRNSLSCRLEHRNSPNGRFTAGFSVKTGNPISRDGFVVTCKTTSDCGRCSAHPLTGDRCADTPM